jgi:hypothetical protein
MALELGAWFDALRGRFPGRLRKDEYQIRECPYCGNPKWNCEVNVHELVFHCWACGVGGTIRGLFHDYGLPVGMLPDTSRGRRELLPVEQEPVRLPAGACEILNQDTPLAGWALRYLTDTRGMTVEEVARYRILYAYEGTSARRVIWPLYEGDELVYYAARRFMKNVRRAYDFPGHRRRAITPVYTGTDRRLTLVLVEGVFEVPKIQRLGYSVMPLLGSAINPAQVRKLVRRNFERYVVFLDRDAVKRAIRIAEELRAERLDAYHVYSSGPDSDELEPDELRRVLDNPRVPGVRAKVLARLGRLE